MKEIIYIEPCAGLGNRLLCLYSAAYWQMQLEKKVVIVWKREPACNVSFDDLFCAHPFEDVIEIYQLGYRNLKYLIPTLVGGGMEYKMKQKCTFYTCEEMQNFYGEGEESVKNRLSETAVFVKATGNYASWDHMKACKNTLVLSASVQKRVECILGSYDRRNLVGVHIRRGDHSLARRMSPIEMFEKRMRQIEECNPEVQFFLATDDLDVEKCLGERHPIIKINHKDYARDKANGIMDAWADMLCLAQCAVILGSYGSTFSLMASFIGDTKLKVITDDRIDVGSCPEKMV